MKSVRFLAATALATTSILCASSAWAQEEKPAEKTEAEKKADEASENESKDEGGQIVVTGSRIARPTLESPVPITTVSAEDLASGSLNIGDALNELPSLRSTFSQANSTRFIGTSGLSILDLRGLGTSRTLVLVDGRRHITALPGDYLIDVNSIPSDLIEGVDVVTGGNSAVYGSDAVAGVVNFRLKKDFDGYRLSAQTGISSRGDYGSVGVSFTAGKNFADGRGNIAVAVEYSRNEALYFTDRDYLTGAFSGRKQFNLAEPTAGEPASGDGIPDTQFFTNVRNNNISDGGLVSAVCNSIALLSNPARCAPGATPTLAPATTYVFDPAGNLIRNPIEQDFRFFGSGNSAGGLGSTLQNTGQLSPLVQRFSVNFLAHFDVADAFTPFIEAKFVRIKANQEGQPSFWQGSIPGFFGGGANLRCDNPFLTAQAYAQLQNIGRCSPAIAYGAVNPTPFVISRFNVDFGGRGETHRRDTYRVVAGVRGNFNDDWRYEIAANYGKLKTRLDATNNLYLFNADFSDGPFLKALDTTRNGAGQIVCRVNAVTVTDAACVPLNPFGSGQPSQAALQYIHTDTYRDERASQFDVTAFVSGDMSQLFELPGGPIGFVVGGEYRKEKAWSRWDPISANGQTFLNSFAPNNYPSLTVKEAFGELEFPILKDVPFFKELTFSASGRISDYDSSAGTVKAYDLRGIWAPVADVRFRGSYSKSVRVPTQSDLFDAQSENFRFIGDPCDVLNINNGTVNRPINCAADGVPVGFVNNPARSQTIGVLAGGNPNLTAEKGRSYTIGAIFEPRWIPGWSVTVDYYNIRVDNLIATLQAGTIISQCYDLPRPNPYCASVFPRDPVTREFGDPAALEGPINFASQLTSGVDIDMAYTKNFDNGDRFTYRVIGSYIIKRNNFTNPSDPSFANRQKGELGDPTYEFSASASYRRGSFTGRWNTRFLGPQTISAYETQNAFQGRPPTNADLLPRVTYPTRFYHDARLTYRVSSKFEAYFGVDNITDAKPPFGLIGTAGGDPFDTIGRYFYFGIEANF